MQQQPPRRVNSMRWENWDYGAEGAYFVTMNCRKHQIWFGSVVDGAMVYNGLGDIAVACWEALPLHFKDVELGEYQVMPNHVHGIIHLLEDQITHDAPLDPFQSPAERRKGNQGRNTVSAMCGSFKSSVSRMIRQMVPEFQWQSRFHDRVIRDAEEYERIANYIRNNPANWCWDEFYREM